MTEIKIDGKLTASGGEALADHARGLYDRLGSTRVGIVELRAVERTTPEPGGDKSPGVKLRIAGLEIAGRDQEGAIREAMRALHLQRTAQGTLDEHGQIQLTQDTIHLTAGLLSEVEAARLRAGLEHWTREIREVTNATNLRDGEIRHELDRIADGLNNALHPARTDDDTDS